MKAQELAGKLKDICSHADVREICTDTCRERPQREPVARIPSDYARQKYQGGRLKNKRWREESQESNAN